MLNNYIEIHHYKIKNNLKKIKKQVGKCQYMAVVKSNAYGHGLIDVSKNLESEVDLFGVGYLEEAITLRESGIHKDILVMGPTFDYESAIKYNLIISLDSMVGLEALLKYLQFHDNQKARVHIKVDTGMHRFGLEQKEIEPFLASLTSQIRVEGVFSHFASTPLLGNSIVKAQFEEFRRMKELFEKHLSQVTYHMANSENAIDFPEARFDMVRIGNALYGPVGVRAQLKLEKVSQIKLPIVAVRKLKKGDFLGYGHKFRVKKDTKIGICKGGFYEGLGLIKNATGQSRVFRIKAALKQLYKGATRTEFVTKDNCPLEIIGNINMQYMFVDITGYQVKVGDYVSDSKSPLYIKESVRRIHLLEDNHEVN